MEKTGRTRVILKWSRRIRWSLMLAVLAYLGICGYMWATQRQHIFEPTQILQTRPDRMGLKFEELSIPSGTIQEHGELYAWWIPADSADAPTMLYLHGNDKNVGYARDIDRAARLQHMGYNVLTFDYRGYGRSTDGPPSEAKVYEDAEAAWGYLTRQRAIEPRRIFIYGHSLGGAVAIDLATHHPEAAGLITESTFTSMTDIAKLEYPLLPVDWLINQRFDSLHKVGSLRVPFLLIHGTWDRLVPYQMSQRLYDRAPQPKFLKLIDGGEHGNTGVIAPLEFNGIIHEFTQHYSGNTPH